MKPEPFLADGHAVLSCSHRVEHARAVGEVNRGGATHGAHDHRARGKGDTRLPHFERHVDWIKARMIDGHRNEASRAVPVARRQNGNRKALDLAGARTMRVSRWWSNLGEPAEGELSVLRSFPSLRTHAVGMPRCCSASSPSRRGRWRPRLTCAPESGADWILFRLRLRCEG